MKLNLIILVLFSTIIALFRLNQSNLKLIFAFSSIIQTSWITFLTYLNETFLITYFLIYALIIFLIINIINYFNINFLIDLINIKFNKSWLYLIFIICIIALGRFPPTFGFLIKIILINSSHRRINIIILFIIIFNSLIRIFFYLRLSWIRIILNYVSLKNNFKKINFSNKTFNFIIWINWVIISIILIYEII